MKKTNIGNQNEIVGFYIQINKDLKKEFNLKCIENGTNMSAVLKNYISNYIDECSNSNY